jgi:hypothetical protein
MATDNRKRPTKSTEHRPKRREEVNIQGWFNPNNPQEGAILRTVERLREKYKEVYPQHELTNKLLIKMGIEALAEANFEDYARTVPDEQRAILLQKHYSDTLYEAVEKLTEMINSGVALQNSHAANVIFNTVQEKRSELDEIQKSAAARYTTITAEDLDMGEDDDY